MAVASYKEQTAREKLITVSIWLSWLSTDLNNRLVSPIDAVKLFEHLLENPYLDDDTPESWDRETYIKAIGYDPYKRESVPLELDVLIEI